MNAIIKIVGTQTVDEEQDVTELTTSGILTRLENGWQLCYRESEATGMQGTETTLDITPGRLNLIRSGTHPSMLILEKDRRHHCNYDTPYGTIDLGTYTSELAYDLDDTGGELHFSYTLGFHGGVRSAHTVHITVSEER